MKSPPVNNYRLRSNASKAALCLLAALAMCLSGWSAEIVAAERKQVLILNSYDESTWPYFVAGDVLLRELQEDYAMTVAFRQIDLNHSSNDGANAEALLTQLLVETYGESKPDLVVSIGPPAIKFWLSNRDAMESAIPFIATAGDINIPKGKIHTEDAVVAIRVTFAEWIEDILSLRPDTDHIVMVFGASVYERGLAAFAKSQIKGKFGGVRFEYTNDYSIGELQIRLSELHSSAAVFYGVFHGDSNGVPLPKYSGLTLVRSASSVPVFGTSEDQVGRGIVGGRLMQLEKLGREVALTANDILNKGSAESRRKMINMSEPVYDWKELEHWGIDADLLPAGSVIRFKPPGLWEQYRWWLTTAGLVFVVQFLLLGGLMLQRRRRLHAERARANLSGKLITAYEDERRLIARELHDDLSQRLARAAIDAGMLSSGAGKEEAESISRDLHDELVNISRDVHDMSYQLHPSMVHDLGLAAALRAECKRQQGRTKSRIQENTVGIEERVPEDAALCAYRIAQEALNNAIKYAAANNIELTAEYRNSVLRLTVADDGKGFDQDKAPTGRGLGLSSMRERAALADGSLTIHSKPGKGTRVSVSIQLKGDSK